MRDNASLNCMLAPIDLNLVRTFVAVYEACSFSAGADRLGVPRSTASRAIAALEARLGLELFRRTTRRVAPTEEGVRLFDRVAPTLGTLEASLADVPEREDAPTGTLRITAIPDLASAVLVEAIARFAARWPDVDIDLLLTSAIVDLAREGVDLALRVQITAPRGGALLSRKVGAVEVQLYAAPTYLARSGTPRQLPELARHDAIAFRGAAPLRPTKTLARQLPARRRIVCDDMRFAQQLVRSGAGIGALPSFLVQEDLVSGALVRVMPRFTLGAASVHLVRPARKHVPRRVTLFRDLVIELLRQRPLTPVDLDRGPSADE
jgi:DNA-binding transcriptional LysR family regulator